MRANGACAAALSRCAAEDRALAGACSLRMTFRAATTAIFEAADSSGEDDAEAAATTSRCAA